MAELFTTTKHITFEVMECIYCGAPYALNKATTDFAKKRGGYHYCPFCRGSQGWDGETKEAEHKRELANLKAEVNRKAEQARRAQQDAEYFERSRNAYKGQVTKIKNRVSNGVCPCCNRYFANLHRHMTTKHPDFKSEDAE
jgi:hypothetical protein